MNKILFLLLFLIFSHGVFSKNVNDQARLLEGWQISKLDEQISIIEEQNNTDIILYTLTSLKGKSSLDYGRELFRLHSSSVRHGYRSILLLYSLEENQFRILRGFGMEWTLSDQALSEIYGEAKKKLIHKKYYMTFTHALENLERKIQGLNWTIKELRLHDITPADTNIVLRIPYESSQPYDEIELQEQNEPEFSERYQIKLTSQGDDFNLYYSKYSAGFVGYLNRNKKVYLLVRLSDWNNKKLLFLAAE